MRKNLLVVLVVSFLTSFAWSAHLMTPGTCFPCIFAANHLRSRIDKSLDTILAIATRSDDSTSIANNYLLDLASLRKHAKEAAAVETAKQLVRCRHARSADSKDSGKTKRRGVSPDLALCHFKICNMGRKRSARFAQSVNALHMHDLHKK